MDELREIQKALITDIASGQEKGRNSMLQWISPFNYDFAIASIPVQIILLIFYGFRRNLPIRQSSYFWLIMISNLIMTSTDIVACEMITIWTDFPVWSLYAINHAFFLAFVIRGWALFAYTMETTRCWNDSRLFMILTALPTVVMILLVLSTPWTHTIYRIGENGYENCGLYQLIYTVTYFYLAVSVGMIARSWKRLSGRMRAGLLSFNIILFIGIIMRKQFYHILVTSYFSIISIIIIYLTAENPDLYRDSRTKLMNKEALDLIQRDYREKRIPFSLLTMSIHNYEASKSIYGVSMVNDGLRIFASWLMKTFPHSLAFYIRNGNFSLLLRGHPHMTAPQMMEEWKSSYDEFQKLYTGTVPMKISALLIPDSILSGNEIDLGDLVRYSNARSYDENRRGHDVFSDQMVESVRKRKSVERAVKDAIAANRFEVYFQPIYSTKEKTVQGAEALARLQDPVLGYISPLDFIPVAEKNGDIMEIGRQVFEKTCIFLKTVDTKKLGIDFININLSPIQCMSHSLLRELSEIAGRHGIPMSMFDFEITESLVEDYDMIQMQIQGLQSMGAELSLDDFGTGASNLTSLMKLPIHVVKIDMLFTRSFFDGKAPFLPDLIRLFQHSNMEIVVEGIETKEMMDTMIKLGCDYEQGFYFSKPLPPEEFKAFMAENSGTV